MIERLIQPDVKRNSFPMEPAIFPVTKKLLELRLKEVSQNIEALGKQLATVGDDGDQMDDPILYQLRAEMERSLTEFTDIQKLLKGGVKILGNVTSSNIVGVGHEVIVDITYPDGEVVEGTILNIGSPYDVQYLGSKLGETNPRLLMVSYKSLLGEAIIGRRVGDDVSYGTLEEKGRVIILSIKPSDLINNDYLSLY